MNDNRWKKQWEKFDNSNINSFNEWIYPNKLMEFQDKKVLDAGCGKGRHVFLIASYAKKIIGIDKYTYKEAIKNNKKIKNIKIKKGDISTMNLKEKFDIIFCIGVLHHTKNPTKSFKNLEKYLKKGGRMIIWVYSKEGNFIMERIVEPLKKRLFFKLNNLDNISKAITILTYIPIYTLYLLPLPFLPLYYYFKRWRTLNFSENWMNVHDKLNASQTQFIKEETVKEWFKGYKKVHIDHMNKVSWRGSGTK